MVDPSHPDQVARLGAISGIDVHPGHATTLMHAAKALAWTGIVRFVASRNEVPKLRSAADTKKLREAMAMKFAYFSTSVDGGTAELDGYDRTQAEARAVRSFENRPLVVLTAMAPFTPQQLKASGLTLDQGARFKEEWRKLHAEQVAFSTRGRQQVVPDATHFIQVDRPDVVVSAVREVVDVVRAEFPSSQNSDLPSLLSLSVRLIARAANQGRNYDSECANEACLSICGEPGFAREPVFRPDRDRRARCAARRVSIDRARRSR